MKGLLYWSLDGETSNVEFASCDEALTELRARLTAALTDGPGHLYEWEIPYRAKGWFRT